jgi:hypothetical protein
LKHIRLIGVILSTFLFLSFLSQLTSGVMGAGTNVSIGGQKSAAPTSALAPQANWIPPTPAYRVSIAPDASHPNKELIYGELDGIYQLDYAYLQAAGLPVDTLDPRTFRMFTMGEEIPIRVEGEADGSFDAGDIVLFYGQGIDSLYDAGALPTNKYTDANIYWLSYGGANGARMAEKDGSVSGSAIDAFLHTQRMETNYWYFSAYPFEHDADHWFWDWMQALGAGNTASRTYNFTIDHLAPGTYTGFLTVNVLGYTDGPHHLKLYVNGNLVFDDSTSWADFDPFEVTVSVPQANFVEGNNTIEVEIVTDLGKFVDKVYTNWIKVGYYDSLVSENDVLAFGNDQAGTASYSVGGYSSNDIQVYDVSDHKNVKHIGNTTISVAGPPYTVDFGDTVNATSRYLALTSNSRLTPNAIQEVTLPVSLFTPTDLLDTSNEADYIVITHADFWDEALRLADYRDRKYRVALVDVQQIYDQFNGGLMSAEAIHDFLAYAHANWTAPQPMFVVLIGDGTSDMRNYKYTPATYIPPYLYLADPDLGETAVQNQFVTLTGGDVLPDMHIGRLPANTLAEAQAMVDKIIGYEVQCQCDSWNYKTLFVADDTEGGGGNFYDFSDRVADGYDDPPANTIKYVPDPPYSVHKIYLGQTCDLNNPPLSVECRAEFTNTLNTDGALFVSWVGHSTKDYWAAEKIVDIPSIDQLDNAPCLPFAVSMTCFEGSFHDPTTEALAEHAVRIANDGFIASWSPTGFGLATGHDLLEEGLMLALFHDDVFELGAAITQAKEHLHAESASGQYDDLIQTFILLGDPALRAKTDAYCNSIPTAVRLESYELKTEPGALHVTWRTGDETDILGFNVLRRPESLFGEDATQAFEAINSQVMLAQWSGLGMGADYSFVDDSVTPGVTYGYKLEIISADGTTTLYDLGNAFTCASYDFPITPAN